jgi:hypothetical protein
MHEDNMVYDKVYKSKYETILRKIAELNSQNETSSNNN